MLKVGEKVRFSGRDAVILTFSDTEVLIFLDSHHIKWISRDLLDDVVFE